MDIYSTTTAILHCTVIESKELRACEIRINAGVTSWWSRSSCRVLHLLQRTDSFTQRPQEMPSSAEKKGCFYLSVRVFIRLFLLGMLKDDPTCTALLQNIFDILAAKFSRGMYYEKSLT